MILKQFFFPCVTYVLERTGINESPGDFVSGKKWNIVSFDIDMVTIGDIVCWSNDSLITEVTLEIVDGVPISERIAINNHYGVYEGNGLVSDLTIDGDSYAPRIRVRDVRKSREPDFRLMRKT